jgi:hypothetical protein
MMRRSSGMMAALGMVAACSGNGVNVGSSGDAGTNSPGPGAAVFTAAQVRDAEDACSRSHGPADVYTTIDGLKARLVGAWWPCAADGGENFCFPGEPVDITADNTWRLLVSDGSGGLTGAQGLQAEGTYGLPNEAGFVCGSSCDVGVSASSGGLSECGVGFETSPRRMLVGGVDWFVAIGP